jgi:hypothetical protein
VTSPHHLRHVDPAAVHDASAPAIDPTTQIGQAPQVRGSEVGRDGRGGVQVLPGLRGREALPSLSLYCCMCRHSWQPPLNSALSCCYPNRVVWREDNSTILVCKQQRTECQQQERSHPPLTNPSPVPAAAAAAAAAAALLLLLMLLLSQVAVLAQIASGELPPLHHVEQV